MHQASLHENLRNSMLDDAQLALAQAIYFLGSAMLMVESDHWKKAWKKIEEFELHLSSSTYHFLQNNLLDKCYGHVKEHCAKSNFK